MLHDSNKRFRDASKSLQKSIIVLDCEFHIKLTLLVLAFNKFCCWIQLLHNVIIKRT